jgi:hypothetical protein
MVDRNEIISAATHIEASLKRSFSTEGRMFGEVISEIYDRVPKSVTTALREVSSLRNEYAHLPDDEIEKLHADPSHFEKRARFFQAVDLVDRYLSQRNVSKDTGLADDPLQSHTRIVKSSNRTEQNMFSEWIIHQPISSMPILIKKPLYRDCFVIFTNKGAPHSVAPVSSGFVVAQSASFFCDGALGIAKELTFSGDMSAGLNSADGVPIRVGFHLKFSTNANQEEHLLQIARESARLLSELENAITGELRRYISSREFDELTHKSMLNEHESTILSNLSQKTDALGVLKLDRLTMTELQSANPSVKSQAQIGFEQRRKRVQEEEADRLRNVQIAQEQQMREMGQEARLGDAKIDAAILETRAEAIRNAGEYSLSQEQLFELFKERIHRDIAGINADARVEVAKQKKGEWVALGAMQMLDRMSLGDSRVRVYQEQDLDGEDDDPQDDREGF